MTKSDQAAADRVLKAACRKAVALIRSGEGQAVAPLLAVAATAAGLLMEGA